MDGHLVAISGGSRVSLFCYVLRVDYYFFSKFGD